MKLTEERIDKASFDTLVPINVLSEPHRDELRLYSQIVELASDESFAPGDDDSGFTYYLIEGSLGLFLGGQCLERIEAGSETARFALTRLKSASVSARALTAARLLKLDISLVSTLLIWVQSAPDDRARALTMGDDSGWVPRVLGSELFARIPPANIQKLFNHLEEQSRSADEVVIRQGDSGDYYYIIRSGKCVVTRATEAGGLPVVLASLGPGESFGEEALVANATRNATVTMVTDGKLLRLTKADFRALVVEPVMSTVSLAEAQKIIAEGGRWLDVRLSEEHGLNGIDGSIHLALNDIREGSDRLDAATPYVVYSDTGRRSMAAAFVLAEHGFSAHVLEGGLARHGRGGKGDTKEAEPASADSAAELPDPRRLSKEVEAANEALENALQEKLDATTARRMLASELESEPHAAARKKLAAKQQRLELESAAATAALAQAQRRKLEAESRMRTAEALAERRRAEAEAECESLRHRAEERLRAEEQRLQEQYTIAARKLEALKQTRRETELRLQRERERIERELTESQQSLQAEARKIKSDLDRIRRDIEDKAGRIRDDEATQEQAVRAQTELALKEERQRLEAEFAVSVSALEKAQLKLNHAKKAKVETDTEARRILETIRAADERRRKDAEAARRAEQQRLEAQARQASAALERAERLKTEAEAKRRAAIQRLARIRAAGGEGLDDAEQTTDLEAEIERIDENVSEALGEVDAARRAVDDAEALKLATEERTAHQRATEKELRGELHKEAEQWLEHERELSAEELERAKQDLADKWVLKEEADRRRRDTQEENESSLFDEISSQLEITSSEGKNMQPAPAASARKPQPRQGGTPAAEDASEQMTRLRKQGLLD